jgi:hypothetical protein
MGEYTSLYFANYDVLCTKSFPVPEVMTIFRENDKMVYERKILERLKLQFPDEKETPLEEWEGANEVEIAVVYSSTVSVIKQRLDIMGFSIRQIKDEFESAKIGLCQEIEDEISYWANTREDKLGTSNKIRNLKMSELNVLQSSTFSDWKEAYRYIYERRLRTSWSKKEYPDEPSLVRFIIEHEDAISSRFPCYDIRSFLRFFLEICPDDALVIQDLTSLVNAGYLDANDLISQRMLNTLIGDYPINEKYLILTEGSTDKMILEPSMRLLFPHLSDYYVFMDFGISNAAGGASSLVSAIKSFVGSGIKNRIIALFDNDTAAYSAMRGLRDINIPDNIKIFNYPNLEFAENYPTLGPSGVSSGNINGLAVSIELFLGRDVLTFDTGEYIPIHWKGYDTQLGQYQGEVQNKRKLLEIFSQKILKCQADPEIIQTTDWDSMRLVLNIIFGAFS